MGHHHHHLPHHNDHYHHNEDTYTERDYPLEEHPPVHPTNAIISYVLMALMVFFFLCLVYLVFPFCYNYIKSKVPVSKIKLQRRYETIEGWLISKRVRAHCQSCVLLNNKKKTKPSNVKLSPSYDTAETVPEHEEEEEEELECPICMECFAVDDIVSWSPTTNCDHVFHHQCVKEWLVYHDACPYCRVTMLPIDKESYRNSTWTASQLAELAVNRLQRLRTTYYCVEEGLVILDSAPDDGNLKRHLSSGVRSAELVALRGGDVDTTMITEEDEPVTELTVIATRPSPEPVESRNSNEEDNDDDDIELQQCLVIRRTGDEATPTASNRTQWLGDDHRLSSLADVELSC